MGGASRDSTGFGALDNVFRTEASRGKTLNEIAITVFIINITDRKCIEPTLLWIKPEAER